MRETASFHHKDFVSLLAANNSDQKHFSDQKLLRNETAPPKFDSRNDSMRENKFNES